MDTAVSQHAHAAVIRLTGELDVRTAVTLRAVLAQQVLAGPGNLVLDLSGLEFVDSSGLAALLAAHQGTRQAGMALVLAGPIPSLRRIMSLTGIDNVLRTEDTVEQALAQLAPLPLPPPQWEQARPLRLAVTALQAAYPDELPDEQSAQTWAQIRRQALHDRIETSADGHRSDAEETDSRRCR